MARTLRRGGFGLAVIVAAAPQLGDGAYAAEQSIVKDVVDEALIKAGVPPSRVAATRKLDDCLDRAVDRLAGQRETDQAVADAALVLCG